MSRRLVIVLLGLVALLLFGSFAAWRWAEGRMAEGYAAWTQAMVADGWTVHGGTTAWSGWPLAVDYSVADFSMASADGEIPGGAAYSAARLTLHLDLLHPAAAQVIGEGQQSVRLGPTQALPFTAGRFVVTIPLTQGTPPSRAALDAAGLHFTAPADGLTIGLLEGEADWAGAAGKAPHSTSLRISAEAITLPPPPAPQAALGPHIASATVEGTLSGTLPLEAPNPAAAAAAWRESGGKLELRRIAVGWGPLGLTGSASLTLDADLQPDATATLRLVGMQETLTTLAAAHVITTRAAGAAKAVAGLLANAPEGGGAPGVEVPVTLHDRTLSLGMIPLTTVEKLSWPDGR
jgi:hypothetical protein